MEETKKGCELCIVEYRDHYDLVMIVSSACPCHSGSEKGMSAVWEGHRRFHH